LKFMHSLPYFMVIAMLLLSCFWLKGGICCCCQGGSVAGLLVIPYLLFWLVSFVVYVIVLAMGIAIRFLADQIEVPVLNGKPTLKEAIEHLETNFPEFWNLVFADMAEGLHLLFVSSAFMTGVALLIVMYSCCLCTCRPYHKKDAD